MIVILLHQPPVLIKRQAVTMSARESGVRGVMINIQLFTIIISLSTASTVGEAYHFMDTCVVVYGVRLHV